MMIMPIIGFENKYTIDEFGNIFNVYINRYMKPYITNKGYKCIDLIDKNKKQKYLIHRLVALHFIPNPNNYPIVLHLDNNKLNTHYSNLKWGTYSENNSQAIKDGINTIPRPDNRKFVIISKDKENEFYIDYFKGINETINMINFKESKSSFANHIYRHTPLKNTKYENMYIFTSKNIPGIIFKQD